MRLADKQLGCATRLNVSVEIPITKNDLENPSELLNHIKSQFSVDRMKRIKVHYKTTFNEYIELDNITQYEKFFEPTFDLENCLNFIPRSWESVEEILYHYLKFYGSNDPQASPYEDIFADYIMIEF